jgi:hypothetical protein
VFIGVRACIVIGPHSPPTDGPKIEIHFHVIVESWVIVNVTVGIVPEGGTLPVPVQPVQNSLPAGEVTDDVTVVPVAYIVVPLGLGES